MSVWRGFGLAPETTAFTQPDRSTQTIVIENGIEKWCEIRVDEWNGKAASNREPRMAVDWGPTAMSATSEPSSDTLPGSARFPVWVSKFRPRRFILHIRVASLLSVPGIRFQIWLKTVLRLLHFCTPVRPEALREKHFFVQLGDRRNLRPRADDRPPSAKSAPPRVLSMPTMRGIGSGFKAVGEVTDR